jgi:hypothetical protein
MSKRSEYVEKLHRKVFGMAQFERKKSVELLEGLHEIDEKRVYADLGYTSIFSYVCEALKYSETQASERVRAMRIISFLPLARKMLENEELSMTCLARVERFVRREKLDSPEAEDLLRSVKGMKLKELDRFLVLKAAENVESDGVHSKFLNSSFYEKVIAKNVTEIKFFADDEFMQLFSEADELCGTMSKAEVLKEALKQFVKLQKMKTGRGSSSDEEKKERNFTAETEVKNMSDSTRTRYVSRALKRYLFERAKNQCEFVSPITGKRCSEKKVLEVDHIIPYCLGGETKYVNLRIYCKTHNLHVAMEKLGVNRVKCYMGGKKKMPFKLNS